MTNSENIDLELLQEFRKEFEIEDSKPNQLEKLLNKFNVFDVLKSAKTEIRHSNVLAWLLDPNESHNIGDKKALKLFLEIIPTPSGVDLTSLINGSSKIDSVSVFREWEHIDLSILIKSGSKRFLIIIENKIKTKDSYKQLEKYRNRVENKFKEDYKKIFIYLTPEGDEPKDKNELRYWNLLSYGQIVSDLLNKVTLVAKGDVKKFIDQYVHILGRIILEDSKVNKLCNEIYKKHKKAINLLFEEKDDEQKEIKSFVEEKIKKENFILEHSIKTFIRFTTETLSEKIKIQGNGKWSGINKIILFEFENKSDRLSLKLVIGPGEGGNQLLSFMKSYKKIFTKNTSDAIEKKPEGHKTVFSMPILSKKTDYDHKDTFERMEKIEKKWPEIVENIEKIDEVFNNNWPPEGGK